MIKTITVPVTADHIANGIRANGQACAIALAMIDAGLEHVMVGGTIVGRYRGVLISSETPWEVGYWIRRFDNDRHSVDPIEITLNVRCPNHGYDIGRKGCPYCGAAADWTDIEQDDWDALMASTQRELVPV